MIVYIVEWHDYGMRVCASYHDAQCFRETLRDTDTHNFTYNNSVITIQRLYIAPDSLTVPGSKGETKP